MRLIAIVLVLVSVICCDTTLANAKKKRIKKSRSTFVFRNEAPFGADVDLELTTQDVTRTPSFTTTLEPNDEDEIERVTDDDYIWYVTVTPLLGAPPGAPGLPIPVAFQAVPEPVEQEFTGIGADECVQVLIDFAPLTGLTVDVSECPDEVAAVMSDEAREATVIAGSTLGLLLLGFFGRAFARAPRRPEEEMPGEQQPRDSRASAGEQVT